MNEIQRVGVVGCGVMGAGIVEVCARAGPNVVVAVSTVGSGRRGRDRLARSMSQGVRKEKLSEDERVAAMDRVTFTTDLVDLADRHVVIEAIREHEPTKVQLFTDLDKIVDSPDAILVSNTSSIPIVKLGSATRRASHVIGAHFFNPAPVLPLVELVPSLLTSEETCARVERFAIDVLGKQVVRSPDRAGFMVNALLIPYLLSAIRMLESGFASADDIDKAMVLGCAHPMGPLRLADLIGLDVVSAIGESLYSERREMHYSPPPILQRMVDAGLLGRKSGRGFHDYSQ